MLNQINNFRTGHSPSKIIFFCFNENPLKFMKNVFYFILKALSALNVLWSYFEKVVPDLFWRKKKKLSVSLDQQSKVLYSLF